MGSEKSICVITFCTENSSIHILVLNGNLEDGNHGTLWMRTEVLLILHEELSVRPTKLRCACGTHHMVNTGGTAGWPLASLSRD